MDPSDCYGDFSFDAECKKCEYQVKCALTTGIYSEGKCKFYPKIDKKNFEEKTFEEKCRNFCELFKECDGLLCETKEIIEKEVKDKKMFSAFFSLGQIRESFIEED